MSVPVLASGSVSALASLMPVSVTPTFAVVPSAEVQPRMEPNGAVPPPRSAAPTPVTTPNQ